MESLSKLEKMVQGWLKPLPHLPESARKWIATNIWWLELIGVIILALSGVTLIGSILFSLGLAAAVLGAGVVYTGLATLSAVVSLIFMVASVVVMAMAISPLKNLKKRGWDLLFLALLINCASIVLSALFNFNFASFLSSIFSGAIGVAIGAYFLFEIRSYFVSIKK